MGLMENAGIENSITKVEAARMIGISLRSLERLLRARLITYERHQGRVVLRRSYVSDYCQGRRVLARQKSH